MKTIWVGCEFETNPYRTLIFVDSGSGENYTTESNKPPARYQYKRFVYQASV